MTDSSLSKQQHQQDKQQQKKKKKKEKVQNKGKKRTTNGNGSGDGNADLNENGRYEDDRLLPYLLQHQHKQQLTSHLQHVPNDLLTKGYSVLPSIFSQQECNDAIDQLWDFVQDTSGNMVQRNDPLTWYPEGQLQPHDFEVPELQEQRQNQDQINYIDNDNDNDTDNDIDPWPHTGYSSFPDMFQSQGAGYVLGQTRLHMAERVFEPLFGTNQLHVSKEGFTFARPTLVSIQEPMDDNLDKSTSVGTDSANGSYTYKWNRPRETTTVRVCGEVQEGSFGEHYDQSHFVRGLQTIQSSVCFIDQVEGKDKDKSKCQNKGARTGTRRSHYDDGHFVCIPHSHSDVHSNITKDIYRGKFAWVPLTQEEIRRVCNDNDSNNDNDNDNDDDNNSNSNSSSNLKTKKEHVHIYAKAGDVILWRSDLIHAAVPPGDYTSHFRAVGYISMSPAIWTPGYKGNDNDNSNGKDEDKYPHSHSHPRVQQVWNEKLNAYKFGKTGDHRSFVESEGWHNHKRKCECVVSGNDSDNSNGNNNDNDHGNNVNWILARQRPFYRYSPPKVTKRLAELYGLIPYNLKSEEEYRDAIARATIRGVRFVDGNEINHNSSNCNSTKHLNSLPNHQLCTAYSLQLKLENNKLLLGQDKYLGGVCSPDGQFIYGVPGHAKRVLRVNTKTNFMDFIGPSFAGEFKWLRGLDIPAEVMMGGTCTDTCTEDESQCRDKDVEEYSAGCCLALPSNASSVLKINCKTNEVKTFGETIEKGWLYHGGNLTEDGFVYAIPANATRVLKIDPRRETIDYIGPKFEGLQKWFGGILGIDGCIYGIPQNASGVLKINPFSQECTVIGELGDGMWKWHGGTAINGAKQIIGFPNNSDNVLVIDVEQQKVFTIGDKTLLQSGRHRIPQDGRYKWLGGAVTLNGKFTYLFPCDAERVLRIDNQTYELSLVGPELLEGENKYQNGFVSKDGAVYGIPQRAAGVLRIIPGYLLGGGDDQVDVLYCGDEMVHTKDKFEGGVIDPTGNIYCIPLRSKTLMKIIPTVDISEKTK